MLLNTLLKTQRGAECNLLCIPVSMHSMAPEPWNSQADRVVSQCCNKLFGTFLMPTYSHRDFNIVCNGARGYRTRVRYGADGTPKNAGPRPFSLPRPTEPPGAGCLFGIPCPCTRSGPRPTHTPDGAPLTIGGNKRGPIQGMNAGA